jgi:pimeloyl-ACP methyl ester carboxylesterase
MIRMEREGVRLAATDFGGTGPPVLLLHGLGGHTGEWNETASWLTEGHRVVALDARGHGESGRRPADVSLEARVADVSFAIEEVQLAPTTVIGQSLGAITALLVAGERPDLVRALVVVDAGLSEDGEDIVDDVIQGLATWPDPHFDLDVMDRTLRESVGRSFWAEWERIVCPTLVVRAERGILPPEEATAMVDRLPQARLVEIPGAGHDLHLDNPAEWRSAVESFLKPHPPV